jgi:hypothetical protein
VTSFVSRRWTVVVGTLVALFLVLRQEWESVEVEA